jgi:tRNA (guanine-N7-)-methyltransferase
MTRVPWSAVFGDDRPVEVEIGPGRGDTLLAVAAARPASNFCGCVRAARAAEEIAARATGHNLGNVRVVAGDARCIVERFVADASVAAYHLYFPDPWPKTRHRDRRLATAPFARALARTLVPGGAVHVASDLRDIVDQLVARLVSSGLAPVPDAAPPPGRPITKFERKYATGGTHYARLVRQMDGGSGSRDADG